MNVYYKNFSSVLDINRVVNELEFAFQPIVNTKTGIVIGYEALLRNYQNIGFNTLFDLFDYAHSINSLHILDINLRKKAINLFIDGFKKGIKLFYNIDNRVIEDKNYQRGFTKEYLKSLNIDPSLFVFEVSERHKISDILGLEIIENYRQQGFKIALDDFGVGNVCLETLYRLRPDIVKIDGFFIKELGEDIEKKAIVESLVKLSNTLNYQLIAEKVENINQIYELDDIGINLVQGYYIAKPEFITSFKDKISLDFSLKRGTHSNLKEEIIKKVYKVDPIRINDEVSYFINVLKNLDVDYLPVVNNNNIPVYLINLKKYIKP
ncbi:MAG: EAL domain-containing protein [Hydrogenothermaceae bacterium]